jgi:hypothetical protein
LELGERHLSDGDADGAIHYFNSALRSEPTAEAYVGLSRAFSLKAVKSEKVFYVLALDALRKAAAAGPGSEELQVMLIGAAVKADRLGDLAVEYREKLKLDPGNEALKKRLRYIYAIALLDSEVKLPEVGYKPALFIKVGFDCVLLPFSAAIIVASNLYPKARPSLGVGVFFFFCYLVYRGILIYFSRRP